MCFHREKAKQHISTASYEARRNSPTRGGGMLVPNPCWCNVFHFILSSLGSFPEFSVY
jgi:hypothetical protein